VEEDKPNSTSTAILVETALRIAKQRRKIVDQMRASLVKKDDGELKRLAALLCGVLEGNQLVSGFSEDLSQDATGNTSDPVDPS